MLGDFGETDVGIDPFEDLDFGEGLRTLRFDELDDPMATLGAKGGKWGQAAQTPRYPREGRDRPQKARKKERNGVENDLEVDAKINGMCG